MTETVKYGTQYLHFDEDCLKQYGSTLVDLCEIWFGGSLGCKLRDDQ